MDGSFFGAPRDDGFGLIQLFGKRLDVSIACSGRANRLDDAFDSGFCDFIAQAAVFVLPSPLDCRWMICQG